MRAGDSGVETLARTTMGIDRPAITTGGVIALATKPLLFMSGQENGSGVTSGPAVVAAKPDRAVSLSMGQASVLAAVT